MNEILFDSYWETCILLIKTQQLLSDLTQQEKPLTGFLSRVGLASGVRVGIQKLGRAWLEVWAELVEDSELLSVRLFSPVGEKQSDITDSAVLTLN